MTVIQAAAQTRPGGGSCSEVQERPGVVFGRPRTGPAWAEGGSRSLRARSGVAELLLLHRLRANATAGMPEQAARVIGRTAQAWLVGGSAGKP
jgi:hypothetical protein